MFWSTHKYVLFFSPHYHDNDLIRLPLSRCCVTWVGAPRVQIFSASKGQVKLSSSRSEVESKQLDHKNFYVPRVPISIAKKYIFKEFSEGTVKQDLTPVPALICGHFPPPSFHWVIEQLPSVRDLGLKMISQSDIYFVPLCTLLLVLFPNFVHLQYWAT